MASWQGRNNKLTVAAEKRKALQRQLELWAVATDAMRKDAVFSDVVLACGEKEFPVHRLMLSGASPYFRAMLHSPMAESNSGRIVLKNIDPDAVEVVLDFIYTGTIKDIEEDKELVRAVLDASHMLLIDGLFEYLIRVMKKELSSDHFIELWNMAELYNVEELICEIKGVVSGNEFETASLSTDFLSMKPSQIKAILPLVKSAALDVTVKAIVAWVRADEEQRQGELPSLMKEVNLNLLSESYLKELLGSETIIQQNDEVFRQLVAVSVQCFEWKRIKSSSRMLCFAKNASNPRLSNVFVKEKDSWSGATILSFMLTRHMSAVGYNGEVYFIGCKNNTDGDTNEVWKYSLTDNACHALLTLQLPVSAAVAVDLLGFIYILGGFDTQNLTPSPVKSVQRFNPVSLKCEQIASTSEAHWFPIVGQLLDFLYVTSNNGIVERYDPNTNQWSTIKPIPRPCFGCCGAFGEGKLFIMPDKKRPCELQVYDPASDEWEQLAVPETGPSHISSRWTIRTHEPNRSVMLLHDKANDTLHYYNPGYNCWQQLTSILLNQFSLAEFCFIAAHQTDEKFSF